MKMNLPPSIVYKSTWQLSHGLTIPLVISPPHNKNTPPSILLVHWCICADGYHKEWGFSIPWFPVGPPLCYGLFPPGCSLWFSLFLSFSLSILLTSTNTLANSHSFPLHFSFFLSFFFSFSAILWSVFLLIYCRWASVWFHCLHRGKWQTSACIYSSPKFQIQILETISLQSLREPCVPRRAPFYFLEFRKLIHRSAQIFTDNKTMKGS